MYMQVYLARHSLQNKSIAANGKSIGLADIGQKLSLSLNFHYVIGLSFTPWILILSHQQQTAFENIMGKEEIAREEQFLLFQ